MAGRAAPEVTSFGLPPERPAVSLVIPLYRVLSFLRFQIGAFAVDPAMADCELIFVLDSPEQSNELEHLLRGLHALYGLPFRLAIMPANHGFAAASNAGAWYNLHFHKGLPRDYPAANQPRLVPAVTGAALMVRSSLIEKLGGFSEDYIIGDYEDSDLCLRLRADGHEIGYVPQSELYHLERQSISRHAGYMRGVACAYNRHLHAQRWSALMETLTNPPALPQPATRQERRRRRRAA
jgi:GT2 family glycosyltransferase